MEAEDVCLPEGGHRNTNPLTVTLLQLSHLGGLLHPEVDLVGVLANDLEQDLNYSKRLDHILSNLQFDVLSVRHL